ncbi:MAG: PAS domain S-box protein [Betaproteobacteria bacterium]|nr:PAS domain S-box protein [Betaproteobacteria bacterium]
MTDTNQLQRLQRAILDNVAYGIISTTPDGIVTSFNPAAERMLGYTADEVIGKHTPILWHDSVEIARRATQLSELLGEPVAPTFDVFADHPRGNLSDEGEWTFIRKDGARVPVHLSVTSLRDESGLITGFIGLAYDLSERKRAEAALAASEQQFRSLVENSPDNVIRYDRQCRARYYNLRMVQTLGINPEKILGMTPLELGAGGPKTDTEYEMHARHVLESGEPSSMELTLQNPRGGVSNHLIRFVAERDAEGHCRRNGHRPRHHGAQAGRTGAPHKSAFL